MAPTHTVEHPTELLAFLFGAHPEAKRTTVRQWLKHGSVRVNGEPVKRSNHPLKTGDTVSIRAKEEVLAESRLAPGMKVLFEDASIVVIDKPEALLSMASATERNKTVYAILTDYVRRGDPQSRARIWIVHRLDRESSGLMVFAKTKMAKRGLQTEWSKAEKRYFAVVEGNAPREHGTLKSHLDETNPLKVYSTRQSERTRQAVTHYRVVRHNANHALIELTPETGRRHQIRVHLADAGCPIIGDPKYGARTNPARRLGLHAGSLKFRHPLTREHLSFESPLPKELARVV
jgi:23S rRNA pseudouridine1911/1915/1917 synthase